MLDVAYLNDTFIQMIQCIILNLKTCDFLNILLFCQEPTGCVIQCSQSDLFIQTRHENIQSIIHSLVVIRFLVGNSSASEFYMPTFRNTLSVPSSYAGRSTYLRMKTEQTEFFETSAYKSHTPGNCSEGSIKHSERGESLESRTYFGYLFRFQLAIFRPKLGTFNEYILIKCTMSLY